MRESRLPAGGTNLFQEIKAVTTEAEKKGIKPLKLSIGQPVGPALWSARKKASNAIKSREEVMHEYQDNGSPGVPDFAKKFAQYHVKVLFPKGEVDFLPIPGIKPMLGLIILACGSYLKPIKVATMTFPGYPTPEDWCRYLRVPAQELPLTPANSFRFSIEDIDPDIDLLMLNYGGHNPSGQTVNREWWKKLCDFCSQENIRVFDDEAYLCHNPNPEENCSLAEVAINYPKLSWMVAYSASKLISNGTGWRVGAIVGSPDFVGDLRTIKGNTDSGFVAAMAAGVLSTIENDQEGIDRCVKAYATKRQILITLLQEYGMKLVVKPKSTFYTLWQTPKEAFGEEVEDSRDFNFTMIKNTGLIGVHFRPYIRYSIVGDIPGMTEDIRAAFRAAKVSY